jgi:aminopeptidase N
MSETDASRLLRTSSQTGRDQSRRRTYRSDYRPLPYAVSAVDIRFELALPVTRVTTTLSIQCRVGGSAAPLVLNGERLRLVSVAIDGEMLSNERYSVDDQSLTLHDPPPAFELTTITELTPAENPGLEGLNCSAGIFYTHCEPEGFRRITYFPDRPDVMARFRCMVIADATLYPVLLSNGHLTKTGSLSDGRHFCSWEDPFPKASYLFALVAGQLAALKDSFTTRSGRSVELAVHAHPDELPFCRHGLAVLKKAMAWDEQAYGREYDLDVFNIAVLRSYPGGAMECKGLNLYTSEFFLASPEVTTDEELLRVEATVGHEYFHNWTGNRVGCRDWFELSLKEGFTVFRQQQFMAAQIGEVAARIDAVVRLRELQFPEDEGAMAHAVRPDSYLTINNFYTATVYNKGAELIRMMSLIVGDHVFSEAAQEFFRRFDGRAATIDQLIETIEEVAAVDLTDFRRWYDFVGRPRVDITATYDGGTRHYTVVVNQFGEREAGVPLHIPIRLGLIGSAGEGLQVRLERAPAQATNDCVVQVRRNRETFILKDVPERTTLSASRGYSAPIKLTIERDDDALAHLAMHDADGFGRWESGQQLVARTLSRYRAVTENGAWNADAWLRVVSRLLLAREDDYPVAGRLLRLPSVQSLAQDEAQLDPEPWRASRLALGLRVVRVFRNDLRRARMRAAAAASHPRGFDARILKNACLWYLMQDPEAEDVAACWDQLHSSELMEDQTVALQMLVDRRGEDRERALQSFHQRWHTKPAVLDLWFGTQAASDAEDCAFRVEWLTYSKHFSLENATRLKAIFDPFTANLPAFHHRSGVGYETVLRVVLALNEANPRLAARFLKPFAGWRRLDAQRRSRLQAALEQVVVMPRVAPELYEIATCSLRQSASAH